MATFTCDRAYRVVEINCPDWYKRDDFKAFLNGGHAATWHVRGKQPGDFSDIFTNYDGGEGADFMLPDFEGDKLEDPEMGLPLDICKAIHDYCVSQGIEVAVIWLKNLEG